MTTTLDHPQPAAPQANRPHRTVGDLARLLASGLGQLLVTVGLICALFLAYELWVTDWINSSEQAALSQQLHTQWATRPDTAIQPVATPPIGQPFAFLHIPRLGSDYDRAIVEGTDQPQLAQGPGHYIGTPMPGQSGNFAVAGHRVGKGSPFLDLDQLRPGDPIIVETSSAWYTYRVIGDPTTGAFTPDANGVSGQEVVHPSNVAVIAPIPGHLMNQAPNRAYLTLTTCNPKYSAKTRLVIHATLDGPPLSKSSHLNGPAELGHP